MLFVNNVPGDVAEDRQLVDGVVALGEFRRHGLAVGRRAGHDPVHILRADGTLEILDPPGRVVGMVAELGLRSIWINRSGERHEPPPTRELVDLSRLPDTLDELVAA